MEAENKIEIAKVIEEHSRRVYDLFERKSKSFRTLFFSLVGILLVLFFFLFFPYVSLQGKGKRINELQDNLGDKIEDLKKNIDAHIDAKKVFEKQLAKTYETRERMIAWEFHRNLEEESIKQERYILSLKKELKDEPEAKDWISGKQQKPQFSDYFYHTHPHLLKGKRDPCFWFVGKTWIKCKFRNKIHTYHNNLLISLLTPDREVAPFINLNTVEKQLSNLKDSFEKWLSGDISSWKKGRQSDDSELRVELSLFWRDYYSILQDSIQRFEKKLTDLRENEEESGVEFKRLEKQKTENENRLKELNRFNELQTPIGQIPAGLNDIVLIFPVILAVCFLLCTSLFCETVRLRRIFHNLYQKKDTDQAILTDSQVALVASLWIDPVDPEQNRTVRFLIFLTPFMFFVMAISLLFYNGLFLNDFSSDTGLFNAVLYIILYVLSLGMFIYGLWQVLIRLRNY
jgi:hypothetical protein